MTFDFSTSHWNQTAFKAFLDLCLFQSFPFFSKRISDWPSGWIKFRVCQHDMKLVVGVAFATVLSFHVVVESMSRNMESLWLESEPSYWLGASRSRHLGEYTRAFGFSPLLLPRDIGGLLSAVDYSARGSSNSF